MKNKYTQAELEATYDCGYKHATSYWLIVGVVIGLIVGFSIAYIKFKQ